MKRIECHPMRLFSSAAVSVDANKMAHGIVAKKNPANASEWYKKAVVRGDLIDYFELSGHFVYKPKAMFIWNKIKGRANFCD